MDKLEQSEHNTVALQTYYVYACLIIKPSIWDDTREWSNLIETHLDKIW